MNAGMTPVATPFFFYLLSGLAIAGGLLVITRRNAVHSALALIVTLLAVAGLFLMLYAPFVAGVQIIVYAGGIMVLFVFVIMLINMDVSLHQVQFNRQWFVGILISLVVGAQLVLAVVISESKVYFGIPAPSSALEPSTQLVGKVLFSEYMLPFEVASILLLVAMIGAVVMAKKKI